MAYANSPKGFQFAYSTAGGYPTLAEAQADTNVTLAVGDAVIWLTTGWLSIALSTSALVAGIAATPCTATAGVRPKVRFYPALPSNVFSVQATTTTSASQTTIGSYRALEGATGAMGLDMADASPGVFHIVGFKPGYTAGTYAHLLVIIALSQYGPVS